ncbi:hypothetical protein M1K46_06925 [Fictibacillus sp. WQ 8-8]|uniref:hypothetical protein n=1 Tax=Fictibacillus sp. WQ 8-8 TaxID=2938788 RepID=UPI0006A78D6A|nr:hypothetical protein [Fictibacillus sp. WQ 8-8]MCQ6265394.1 hypothetical protein [Fictibacillus sp. WQ 8-8]
MIQQEGVAVIIIWCFFPVFPVCYMIPYKTEVLDQTWIQSYLKCSVLIGNLQLAAFLYRFWTLHYDMSADTKQSQC